MLLMHILSIHSFIHSPFQISLFFPPLMTSHQRTQMGFNPSMMMTDEESISVDYEGGDNDELVALPLPPRSPARQQRAVSPTPTPTTKYRPASPLPTPVQETKESTRTVTTAAADDDDDEEEEERRVLKQLEDIKKRNEEKKAKARAHAKAVEEEERQRVQEIAEATIAIVQAEAEAEAEALAEAESQSLGTPAAMVSQSASSLSITVTPSDSVVASDANIAAAAAATDQSMYISPPTSPSIGAQINSPFTHPQLQHLDITDYLSNPNPFAHPVDSPRNLHAPTGTATSIATTTTTSSNTLVDASMSIDDLWVRDASAAYICHQIKSLVDAQTRLGEILKAGFQLIANGNPCVTAVSKPAAKKAYTRRAPTNSTQTKSKPKPKPKAKNENNDETDDADLPIKEAAELSIPPPTHTKNQTPSSPPKKKKQQMKKKHVANEENNGNDYEDADPVPLHSVKKRKSSPATTPAPKKQKTPSAPIKNKQPSIIKTLVGEDDDSDSY
jgi:hypothetical protein